MLYLALLRGFCRYLLKVGGGGERLTILQYFLGFIYRNATSTIFNLTGAQCQSRLLLLLLWLYKHVPTYIHIYLGKLRGVE